MRYFIKKRRLFGLSIQANAIQLIELKDNNKCYEIEAVERLETNHAFKEQNKLVASIETIVAQAHVHTKYVAIHVPHHVVKEAQLTVPIHLKKEDIRHEIDAHIQTSYPALKDNVYVSYTKEQDSRKRQERIAFVLAKKTYIDYILHALQQTKLIVKIIDTEQHALIRVWKYLIATTDKGQEFNGILSLSPTHALLLLFKHERLILSETIAWQQDINALNQLISTFALSRLPSPLHVLLTGDRDAASALLRETSPIMTFHTHPLFNVPAYTPDAQSEFYIAFGLAMRKLKYGL